MKAGRPIYSEELTGLKPAKRADHPAVCKFSPGRDCEMQPPLV